MQTPPIAVETTAQNVVVKVPSQILKMNKHTLIAAGVGIGVGVVAGVSGKLAVDKIRERRRIAGVKAKFRKND